MQFHRACLVFILLIPVLGCGQVNIPDTNTLRSESITDFFKTADTNKDGVLGSKEIQSSIEKDFKGMDSNNSGLVTLDDIYNPDQAIPEGGIKDLNLSSHLPYDIDNNQAITLEEYQISIKPQLIAMDADSDGQVTLLEYKKSKGF